MGSIGRICLFMVGPSIPLQFGADVMLYIDTMMTIISESVADVPPIDVV